jgi:hypothetical protein
VRPVPATVFITGAVRQAVAATVGVNVGDGVLVVVLVKVEVCEKANFGKKKAEKIANKNNKGDLEWIL